MAEKIVATTNTPQKVFRIEMEVNDDGVISKVGLYDEDKIIGEYVVHFRQRKPAILYLLRKCYNKMEAEYVDRERRINYALGETRAVGAIRVEFSWTDEGKAIRDAIKEIERC